MKWKTKFIETMKRYKHAWVFLYALIYMPWFWFLEKHVTMNYHVVQTALDEEIPFIEYFIVPYMLWFVFIAATFLYFFVTDVQGFYKLAKISFAGMTIFLIICPGHHPVRRPGRGSRRQSASASLPQPV